MKYLLSILTCILLLTGCKRPPEEDTDAAYVLDVPAGFPQPNIPADNELTEARIKLGRKLFYDNILSLDQTISCASCHSQSYAFSDTTVFSKGVNDSLGTRNTMPLFNLAWSNSMFWDGGVPTLELQVMAPIQNHLEMNLDLDEAITRLRNHPEYPALFRKAYDRKPDLFGLFRAIACYERTLISGNSRFDQYYYQGKTNALNDSEIRGMEVFFGDSTHCSSCHTGVLFTNQSFQNNGLYTVYPDGGRYNITYNHTDHGKFKVPSLRNIALTAPYMHDGSIATLEGVIDHYESGGSPNPNKSPHIHGMTLTAQEKTDLVNFLKSLTDTEFINNPDHRP